MAKPYVWTDDIEAELLERIGKGQSVVEIASDDRMPSQSTVYKRLAADEGFAKRYACAREVQADTIFDEILQIADDATNDWMERKGENSSGYELNGEHVQRSRLRIDARKWMAGKLRPKVYGDKLELGGNVGLTVTLESDADKL